MTDYQTQEEHLDWLHQLHEELRVQTHIQERTARAVELIRGVAIVFLVFAVIAVAVVTFALARS